MKKITCEDIGRWMAQSHPEIADAPKEIKGPGFYIAPMIYGGRTSVVVFASDGTWSCLSSDSLAKAFGSRGGFWRRIRDRRVARMMCKCMMKAGSDPK